MAALLVTQVVPASKAALVRGIKRVLGGWVKDEVVLLGEGYGQEE